MIDKIEDYRAMKRETLRSILDGVDRETLEDIIIELGARKIVVYEVAWRTANDGMDPLDAVNDVLN